MAKIDREALARLNGMDYAVRRIKAVGMEEFEKELKTRNRSGMTLPLDNKAIQKATESFRITDEQKNYLRTLKIRTNGKVY